MKTYVNYLDYLIENLGRVDLKGINYAAASLNYDLEFIELKDIYVEVAQAYDTSPVAVARALQYYIKAVQDNIKDYPRDEDTVLNILEFLKLIKHRVVIEETIYNEN